MRDRAERHRDVDRFLTFVDAVVAIAITLLVLPLAEAAGEESESVIALLREHSSEIVGFLLSFGVIALLWFAQQGTLRHWTIPDSTLQWLLVLWLLTIVFLPFVTALAAEREDDATTKTLYIGTMAASSAVLLVIDWVLLRRPGLRPGGPAPNLVPGLITVAAFLIALGLSLLLPAVGYYPLLLLAFVGPLSRKVRRPRSS